MRLADWLVLASSRLSRAGVESASLEAQLLAAHVLLVDRAWILAHPEEELPDAAAESLLQRREAREPLAYLLGRREFYGRSFFVRPGVLIPRQETEMLVDFAVRHAPAGGRVLEIGVGSGCVCVSVALERPDLEVWGTDISARALSVASQNAEALGASVLLRHADLYPSQGSPEPLPPGGGGAGEGGTEGLRNVQNSPSPDATQISESGFMATPANQGLRKFGVPGFSPSPLPPSLQGRGTSEPLHPGGGGAGEGGTEGSQVARDPQGLASLPLGEFAASQGMDLGQSLRSSKVSGLSPSPLPPSLQGRGNPEPLPPGGGGAGEGGRFHLILSNPPYIDPAADLPPELGHEPEEALFAREQGLEIYRRIAETARDHLVPGGQVGLELGIGQAEPVARIFQRNGWTDIRIQPDLAGIPRLFAARLQ